MLPFPSYSQPVNCSVPGSPIIPDGNVASEDQLISAKKAMRHYQEQLASYRQCLHAQTKDIDTATTYADKQNKRQLDLYNDSIKYETQIVENYNRSVRAYKSRGQ